MHFKTLMLATAVALAGCGPTDSGSDSTQPAADSNSNSNGTSGTGNNNGTGTGTGTGSTGVGIPGPADPIQTALSEQLFGALISGSSALPAPLPAAQVLTCLDNTVSLRTLDVLDALALDAAAGQATLTAPQQAALATAVQDLLLSVGGLLMSMTGSTSCDLDPSALPLPGSSMPGANQLPFDPAQLQALLTGFASQAPSGGGSPVPMDPTQLAAQADALRAISTQLRSGAGTAAQAPLVPAVLLLVADVVDGVVDLLQAAPTPEGYQAGVTALASTLATDLQALPQQLAASGSGSPASMPGFDGLSGLGALQGALTQIPVIGAPLAGVLSSLTSLQP